MFLTTEDMDPKWNCSQTFSDTRRKKVENKAEDVVVFLLQQAWVNAELFMHSTKQQGGTLRGTSKATFNYCVLKEESEREESKPIKLESKGQGKAIHVSPSNSGTRNSRK